MYKTDLADQARAVLRRNWRNGFTIPAEKLYPFQWNWDSGFVSMGYSLFDLDKAMEELRSLFSGQWKNGMVPHIIFHSENETTYFPNHDFWEAQRNPGAPSKPKTSGISQPPVHGFVLEKMDELHGQEASFQGFLAEIFPKALEFQFFWYRERDPDQEGLVYIYHPWESGRDNSPLWDESLQAIEFDKATLPPYERKDDKISDPSERPTGRDYDLYVYLLELGKKYGYAGPPIAANSPFLIQDTLINAVLIASNSSLLRLGKKYGWDCKDLDKRQEQSIRRFREKLWNEDLGFFTCYDIVNKKQVAIREIGGLVALFAEIASDEQAKRLRGYLQQLHDRGYLLCPSFDVDHPLFDSRRYWRGPVWPQMNWLVCYGLKKYGYDFLAATVRTDFLQLVSQLGFYEYFEPQKQLLDQLEHGYGGNHFSWTAAVTLDFLTHEP
jgi:hypothetical protein